LSGFRIDIQAHAFDTSTRDRLFRLLGEDNTRRTGRPDRQGFAVLLRDDGDEVIGGLWGVDDFGWAYIALLYVPPALQGRGIGALLMAEAEAIARERSMAGIWVNTYDFQAPGFYRKLGYSTFATLEAAGEAAGQVFLRKRFQQS
jgi:GNAT superfamily N-acetyltransferase